MRKTTSPEATKQLASTLAPYLRAGDVVVLEGDLGAGKTQFVQGVAAGLGIRDQVTSPTFNILLSYPEGSLPLYHFDLYRLEHPDELEDIGYFETIDGDGASFVEWGEKFPKRCRTATWKWCWNPTNGASAPSGRMPSASARASSCSCGRRTPSPAS